MPGSPFYSWLSRTEEAEFKASELNEYGAHSIEVGCFDRAIEVLVRALDRLSEAPSRRRPIRTMQSQVYSESSPQHFNLESCMQYTHRRTMQWYQGKCPHRKTKTPKESCSSSSEGGYVYRQPVRIPAEAILEGQITGKTLSLIISFNLALAYHLRAIEHCDNHKIDVDRFSLQKVLQLYETSYRWQMEEEEEEQQFLERYYEQQQCDATDVRVNAGVETITSQNFTLQFTMIIANNLGQIHRLVNNESKHQTCLQHLLSTLMLIVVDHQQQRDDDSRSTLNVDREQFGCYGEESRCSFFDLEDFFRNASQLILKNQAAAAA